MAHAIPARILKQFCESYLPIVLKIINQSITVGTFQIELKLVEVTPVEVTPKLDKENYKVVSILPHMRKVFVRTVTIN